MRSIYIYIYAHSNHRRLLLRHIGWLPRHQRLYCVHCQDIVYSNAFPGFHEKHTMDGRVLSQRRRSGRKMETFSCTSSARTSCMLRFMMYYLYRLIYIYIYIMKDVHFSVTLPLTFSYPIFYSFILYQRV
jgi:hypothetical protein